MIAILLFIGITAIAGTVCYFIARARVLEYWERWQEDREQTRQRQQKAQRQQALRAQATATVLRQLAQQEEAAQSTRRKAA